MKIAYKIITPILSVAAIAIGIVLKLFHFAVGIASEELNQYIQILENFGVKTKFEFSVVDIVQLLLGVDTSKEAEFDAMALVQPILPQLVAFVVFFVLALAMLIAVGVVAAATNKRKTVIILCAVGLVICFVAIIISNSAFTTILTGEDINLTDIVTTFSDNALVQLASAFAVISSATLSGGFYGVFGMYILIILWTVIANMLIKQPIQVTKKHRRKKPIKSVSAMLRR